MATHVHKQKARGREKKMKNGKMKMKLASDDRDLSSEDLMTLEDKQLLKDVNDDNNYNEESALDVDVNGNDVPESEILGYLQKLGVGRLGSTFSPKQNKGGVKREDAKVQKGRKPGNTQPTDTMVSKGMKGQNKTRKLKEKKPQIMSEKIPEKPTQNHHVNKAKAGESQAAVKFLQIYKTRKHLMLKPGEMWREEEAQPLASVAPDEKLLNEAEKLAERLLKDEVALYSKQKENMKRSEARWLKTVLSSGTLSDKMAALMLLVQESPLHNLASLETLISMTGKKGRRESMMAVDTVRDLFLTGLLPDNRKLRAFNQQPLLDLPEISSRNIESRDKFLIMWYFENVLKTMYGGFIKTLGEMSFDTLQATKEKSISTIHQLLTSKPEQENLLLPMLVNKLGDPTVKSKATYLLTKLVDDHPNMKSVVVREIQHLLFRPNISQRAQYYAICFLAQLRLSQKEEDLASKLIEIYFHFFQAFLKKGDVDNKMMSSLLTGVNRAYVYTKAKRPELSEQLNSIYKIIPSVNFHTGVQALMLLYQVTDAGSNAADRYYMSLYRKLSDPALKNSSKQAIFMNLLFKSLKNDVVDRRTKAFIKRILQVYSQQPPQIICAILVLLSQVLKERPGLLEVKHMAENGVWSDEEEEKFVDLPAPDDFPAPLVNGEADDHPPADEGNADQEENESEHKVSNAKSSWIHRVNFGGSGGNTDYDPYNRNPLYCHAESESMWELQQLAKHYHPSVRLYASCILKGQTVDYDGDPLRDYTLIRFLDRFVYKNPKKNMDQNLQMFRQFKKKGPSGMKALPVNSKDFLEAGEEAVPEDEKFFHRYFMEKAKRRKDDGSDMDSDDGSVGDEEFDSFLDAFEKNADRDDIGDMDLDFAGDKNKKESTTVEKKESSDEEESDVDDDDDDDDDDLDLEDDELAAEFQEEMKGLEDDDSDMDESNLGGDQSQNFNEEDVEFSPDDDDELKAMMLESVDKKGKKRSRKDTGFLEMEPGGSKKKKKKDTLDLFASAEEFAHLLEEDTESGMVSLGGTGDMRNKDKSAQKQLKWEADRDKWMKGSRRGFKPHKKKFGDKGRIGKSHKKKPRSDGPGGKKFGKNKKPNQKQFRDRRKK